jgi:hypothetical protein
MHAHIFQVARHERNMAVGLYQPFGYSEGGKKVVGPRLKVIKNKTSL